MKSGETLGVKVELFGLMEIQYRSKFLSQYISLGSLLTE